MAIPAGQIPRGGIPNSLEILWRVRYRIDEPMATYGFRYGNLRVSLRVELAYLPSFIVNLTGLRVGQVKELTNEEWRKCRMKNVSQSGEGWEMKSGGN